MILGERWSSVAPIDAGKVLPYADPSALDDAGAEGDILRRLLAVLALLLAPRIGDGARSRSVGPRALSVQPGPNGIPNVAVIHGNGAFFAHVDEYRFLDAAEAIAVRQRARIPIARASRRGGHDPRRLEVQAGAIEIRRIRLILDDYGPAPPRIGHFESHASARGEDREASAVGQDR